MVKIMSISHKGLRSKHNEAKSFAACGLWAQHYVQISTLLFSVTDLNVFDMKWDLFKLLWKHKWKKQQQHKNDECL